MRNISLFLQHRLPFSQSRRYAYLTRQDEASSVSQIIHRQRNLNRSIRRQQQVERCFEIAQIVLASFDPCRQQEAGSTKLFCSSTYGKLPLGSLGMHKFFDRYLACFARSRFDASSSETSDVSQIDELSIRSQLFFEDNFEEP